MDQSFQDSIEKVIVINAPQEKVYEAITSPERITSWFPSAIEGTLNVGDRPILDFGEHGKNQIYVESAKPHEYFAYRWIPGSRHFIGDVLSQPNTLVEFIIQEVENGTRVTLKETGFASLPAEVRDQKLAENTGGWDYMLNRLKELLASK
ncbi:MAG: Aha1 domain superfamily [Candidatus Saccharibacteria bacterium]|nr:Aha1 domain superfamily [Candidatus Saccharibacteria bacterium]